MLTAGRRRLHLPLTNTFAHRVHRILDLLALLLRRRQREPHQVVQFKRVLRPVRPRFDDMGVDGSLAARCEFHAVSTGETMNKRRKRKRACRFRDRL